MTVAAITGANRGIGLELARQLATSGTRVYAIVRSASDELKDLATELDLIIVEDVDVTKDADLEQLDERVRDSLDLLICNAGILSRQTLDDLDWIAIQEQFAVNALGPLRTVDALRHKLIEGSKVGIVTSRMGSVEDNMSGSHYGYRMSKAAANMAGRSLAHDLKPGGVSVALLHPGFVRTDMTGGNGNVDPDESARGLLARLDELTLETTGRFWHMNGDELPW